MDETQLGGRGSQRAGDDTRPHHRSSVERAMPAMLTGVAMSTRPIRVAVFGFGQDRHRDLYVLRNSNGVRSGETGVVLRIEEPYED